MYEPTNGNSDVTEIWVRDHKGKLECVHRNLIKFKQTVRDNQESDLPKQLKLEENLYTFHLSDTTGAQGSNGQMSHLLLFIGLMLDRTVRIGSVIVENQNHKNKLHDVDLPTSKLLIIHFLIFPDIFGHFTPDDPWLSGSYFPSRSHHLLPPPAIHRIRRFFPPSLPPVQVPSVSLSRTNLSVQRVPVPVFLNNANSVDPTVMNKGLDSKKNNPKKLTATQLHLMRLGFNHTLQKSKPKSGLYLAKFSTKRYGIAVIPRVAQSGLVWERFREWGKYSGGIINVTSDDTGCSVFTVQRDTHHASMNNTVTLLRMYDGKGAAKTQSSGRDGRWPGLIVHSRRCLRCEMKDSDGPENFLQHLLVPR
ncbi:hypothetical protein EV368DRAFT_64107 [Lentinula lateritia]|nr:hypothetical protein EV368DRAFT_64107 [Lentinula lateritia]